MRLVPAAIPIVALALFACGPAEPQPRTPLPEPAPVATSAPAAGPTTTAGASAQVAVSPEGDPGADPGGEPAWKPFDDQPGRIRRKRVEAPPLRYTLKKPVPVASTAPPPRLSKVREGRNKITDEEDWFTRNALPRPVAPFGGRSPPPAGVRSSFFLVRDGTAVIVLGADRRAIADLDFVDFVGPIVADPGASLPFGMRPSPQGMPQDLRHGELRGDILFVSHGHMGYAADSGGHNAYVSAVDVRTGELHWRSDPLVANAVNFVLVGAHIVCGYGFTAEPDFIYVLEQATGKVVKKVPVASGPEYFVVKDDKLHVRTYDMDYVFQL